MRESDRYRERKRHVSTIITSETELMDRMYMVTPTVTGVPATERNSDRKAVYRMYMVTLAVTGDPLQQKGIER